MTTLYLSKLFKIHTRLKVYKLFCHFVKSLVYVITIQIIHGEFSLIVGPWRGFVFSIYLQNSKCLNWPSAILHLELKIVM